MKRKGFTLVEIMIVVAIIALLAAIAIPNLLTARKTANDTAAKAELKSIQTALENYYIDNDEYAAAANTANLSHLEGDYLRKDICESGNNTKAGHDFVCDIDKRSYSVSANYSNANVGTKNWTLTGSGIEHTNP